MNRRSFLKFFGIGLVAAGAVRPAKARVCERNVGTLRAIYPVGAIYISTTNVNPADLFGFGTWQAFGAGRTLVGVGTSDRAFPAGETGGTSTHALTAGQMPRHTHIQNAHSHSFNFRGHNNNDHHHFVEGNSNRLTAPLQMTGDNGVWGIHITAGNAIVRASPLANVTWFENANTTSTNQHTGGSGSAQSAANGTAHNNLQPYITVFMWRRSA